MVEALSEPMINTTAVLLAFARVKLPLPDKPPITPEVTPLAKPRPLAALIVYVLLGEAA